MKTRTNIVLDDKLISEARKYSEVKTKKGVIELALTEYVETHKRKNLTDLRGKINFQDGYDHKKLRHRSLNDIS